MANFPSMQIWRYGPPGWMASSCPMQERNIPHLKIKREKPAKPILWTIELYDKWTDGMSHRGNKYQQISNTVGSITTKSYHPHFPYLSLSLSLYIYIYI